MPESDFSGSFPHDLLDLRDWRWQGPVKASGGLGTEGDGKAISVPDDESDTTKITIFRNDPWFMLVDDDTTPYVRLGAPARGATTGTSSSSTTRSELREMHFPERARKSSWDATEDAVHNLKVRLAVATVMQNDDGNTRG
jgi:Alginate lyase